MHLEINGLHRHRLSSLGRPWHQTWPQSCNAPRSMSFDLTLIENKGQGHGGKRMNRFHLCGCGACNGSMWFDLSKEASRILWHWFTVVATAGYLWAFWMRSPSSFPSKHCHLSNHCRHFFLKPFLSWRLLKSFHAFIIVKPHEPHELKPMWQLTTHTLSLTPAANEWENVEVRRQSYFITRPVCKAWLGFCSNRVNNCRGDSK